MRWSIRSIVAAAVFMLAAGVLAAPAGAATCVFTPPTVTITIGTGETATIARSGDAITLDGTPCDTATVQNTDTIAVDSGGASATVVIDLGGGVFAPGATSEDADSEIEFTINVPGGILRIAGGSGDDHVVAGANLINLNPGEATADADVTVSGTVALAIDGGAGADRLSFGGGSGTGAPTAGSLLGGDGDDVLLGGTGGSTLDGGAGTDAVDYAAATQLVLADLGAAVVNHQGGGVDSLVGVENLTGSPGDDVIHGDDANNVLRGAEGADTIEGNGGDDGIDGGPGTDTVDYGDVAAGVNVDLATGIAMGEGSDVITTVENVIGSPGNDRITGDRQANVLSGGEGNDTIDGGDGDDTLSGGDGVDTASFASSSKGVTVDVGKGTATGAGADTLNGFENVDGSGRGDAIRGSGAANVLDGRGGRDEILGANGPDVILGSDGNDLLFGEKGDDTLRGGKGKDQLDGGSGSHDICKGGPDPDSFVLCENYPT